MPVSNSEDSAPLGVIVFGLSPRLNWTESYALFLNLLTRQFSTGLSTVISHEEEVRLSLLLICHMGLIPSVIPPINPTCLVLRHNAWKTWLP